MYTKLCLQRKMENFLHFINHGSYHNNKYLVQHYYNNQTLKNSKKYIYMEKRFLRPFKVPLNLSTSHFLVNLFCFFTHSVFSLILFCLSHSASLFPYLQMYPRGMRKISIQYYCPICHNCDFAR